MTTPFLTYYLNSKVDELEKHFLSDVKIEDYFTLEKILLFHAAFYNNFPQSVSKRIDLLFRKIYSKKSDLNVGEFVYNYVSLILLQKLLDNIIERYDDYLQSILNYSSHHLSSNRRVFTLFISFLLDKKFNCEYELRSETFKENLVNHCVENIKHRHGGNTDNYALVTFLNVSSEEKKKIFETLLKTAKEYDHSWDFDDLASLSVSKENIVNPFFTDFMSIQQIILAELSELKLPKDYKTSGDQLTIFNDSTINSNNNSPYGFKDIRLQHYLKV